MRKTVSESHNLSFIFQELNMADLDHRVFLLSLVQAECNMPRKGGSYKMERKNKENTTPQTWEEEERLIRKIYEIKILSVPHNASSTCLTLYIGIMIIIGSIPCAVIYNFVNVCNSVKCTVF